MMYHYYAGYFPGYGPDHVVAGEGCLGFACYVGSCLTSGYLMIGADGTYDYPEIF